MKCPNCNYKTNKNNFIKLSISSPSYGKEIKYQCPKCDKIFTLFSISSKLERKNYTELEYQDAVGYNWQDDFSFDSIYGKEEDLPKAILESSLYKKAKQKERICFKCHTNLDLVEFLKENTFGISGKELIKKLIHLLKLWDSKYIELYCCICYYSLNDKIENTKDTVPKSSYEWDPVIGLLSAYETEIKRKRGNESFELERDAMLREEQNKYKWTSLIDTQMEDINIIEEIDTIIKEKRRETFLDWCKYLFLKSIQKIIKIINYKL